MKFKRTITLAILAAVLSANLVACVAEKDPNKDPNQTYTDANGNVVTQGPREDPNTDPAKLEYTNVSKTVYVKKKSTLKPIDSKEKSITLEAPARLECFAQSTDKSAEWLKVRYDGVEYYIARGRTTDDDVEADNFVSVNNEEMTVCVDSTSVRKYPSAESFSDILTYAKKGEKVTVVGKNVEKKWYKVKYTSGSKSYEGYIKYSSLSEDYSKKFTVLATRKTVYVISEKTANLRYEPIPSENGQGGGKLVESNGVDRGTTLTAIAEGEVNGLSWYKVLYKKDDNTPSVECYIAKSEVSENRPDAGYSMDELIAKYGFTKFSEPVKAYATANGQSTEIFIRESPSTDVKNLGTVKELTIYAYGDGLDKESIWCLVVSTDGKMGFSAYNYLTLNPDGKTMNPPKISLEYHMSFLLRNYTKFTKVQTPFSKTAKNTGASLYRDPSGKSEKLVKTISKGTSVMVVAEGKGNNEVDSYYIVEVDGAYYFALQSAFN